MLEFIEPNWNAPSNIKALTTTRLGGVSQSPFDSLNLGDHVSDDDLHVAENRRVLAFEIERTFDMASGDFQPIWLKQEHTIAIINDEQLALGEANHQACDGIFTVNKRVVCTIMTADCLPVFICNQSGDQISLVHAGWRGLADGIVEKAMANFADPAEELLVHCGPAISQSNFEIGSEVKKQLAGSEELYQRHKTKANHCYADLPGLLKERVESLGANFTQSTDCTFDDAKRFFSYRRDGVTGRMVSLLWME